MGTLAKQIVACNSQNHNTYMYTLYSYACILQQENITLLVNSGIKRTCNFKINYTATACHDSKSNDVLGKICHHYFSQLIYSLPAADANSRNSYIRVYIHTYIQSYIHTYMYNWSMPTGTTILVSACVLYE